MSILIIYRVEVKPELPDSLPDVGNLFQNHIHIGNNTKTHFEQEVLQRMPIYLGVWIDQDRNTDSIQ